jgi:hypothetical protein
LQQFVWGCVGALIVIVLPHAADLIKDVSSPLPAEFGTGFLLGMGVFVLAGGVWIIALEGHSVFLGLYHGGTAPLALSFLLRISSPMQAPHLVSEPATGSAPTPHR